MRCPCRLHAAFEKEILMDSGLHEVYLDELRELYDVEQQLVKALPKFADIAGNIEFRDAIKRHLEQTKYQIIRLEQIFERMGEKPAGQECFVMKVLVQDAYDLNRKDYARGGLDAALLTALQRIEHYEIAGYGAVRSFARQLGHNASANQLQQTLNEKAQADRVLSELAEIDINPLAVQNYAAAH
jgi:ferritin-like metal-binding protein YciE